MEAEPFRETPMDEGEHKLWNASHLYIHGDIGVDTFEEIELPYARDFKRFNLISVPHIRPYSSSLSWQIILSCILIIFCLIIFFITKNFWTFASLLIVAYPLHKILDYISK